MLFARVLRIAQSRPISTTGREVCILTGPSMMIIPGSIRVAIKTKKRIKIVTTSIFKGVSDGGGLNIYNLTPKPTYHG